MDKAKFGDNAAGQIIKLSDVDDWAFVPDPLPPKWEFPARLWPLLCDAHKAVARLDGIGRSLESPRLLLQPLERNEAMRSSSLEGTYVTPEELMLFEVNPRNPKSARDRANDWQEVHNYLRALHTGCRMLKTLPLSLRVITEMHKILLSGVRGRDKDPGAFRRLQVHVGSDRRYVPPPPQHVMGALSALEVYLHDKNCPLDPLVRSYVVHYQFEAIHPFRDGNGRIGRLLLGLTVYQWCGLNQPWLYMSSFFDRYKEEYIDKLFNVSAKADWDSWIEFCLRGTLSQATDAIGRCDKLQELKKEFTAKLSTGSARLHALLQNLFERPIVGVAEYKRRMEITYPTASADIKRLVELKILEELEGCDVKTYYAPRIFDAAYGDQY